MKFNGKNVRKSIKEYKKSVKACSRCVSKGALDINCPRYVQCIIGEDRYSKNAFHSEEMLQELMNKLEREAVL